MYKISTLFAAAAIASSAALLPVGAQASLGGNLFQNIPETFPHIYLSGLAGTNNSIIGRGEALMPIYLQGDKIFYGDLQANVSGKDKNWQSGPYVYSAGLGYRQIYNNRLYGGYLFADRHMSSANKQFWVLSPGFEDWGKVWDFEVTGYYPLSRTLAHEGWASNFGDYSHVTFQGHTQFDHWFKYYEKMGPGLTAEVGRTLLNPRWKGYLAGYYFNIKDSHDILGAGLRLTYRQDDHLKFILEDSYDNENHNLIMGGFRISLTGSNDDQDMHNRLFAPADRYYITSLTQSSSLPINTDAQDQGNGVQFNNIVFFKPEIPGSGPSLTGNGTYENPYIGFDQNYVNQVHTDFANGARMYFEKGFNGEVNVFDYGHVGEISLYGNQGIFGRTDDFKAPAQNGEREIFHGHFGLNGGNTLDSIKVFNWNPPQGAGDPPPYTSGVTVTAGAVGNVISNTQIGTNANDGNNFRIGIALLSGSELSLNNSTVYAYSFQQPVAPGGLNEAIGVDNDGATFNSNDSTIDSKYQALFVNYPDNAYGILAHAGTGKTAVTTVNGGTILSTTNSNNTAYGISNEARGGNATLNVNNATITNNSSFKTYGIYNFSIDGGVATTNIDGSTINTESGNTTYGIYNKVDDFNANGGISTVNFKNSTVNVTTFGVGYGVYNESGGGYGTAQAIVNIEGGAITSQGGNVDYGIYNYGYVTLPNPPSNGTDVSRINFITAPLHIKVGGSNLSTAIFGGNGVNASFTVDGKDPLGNSTALYNNIRKVGFVTFERTGGGGFKINWDNKQIDW